MVLLVLSRCLIPESQVGQKLWNPIHEAHLFPTLRARRTELLYETQSMRLYEIVDSTLRFVRLPVQILPLERSEVAFFSNGGFGCGTLVLRLGIHLKGFWVEMVILGYFAILFGCKLVSGEPWVWKSNSGCSASETAPARTSGASYGTAVRNHNLCGSTKLLTPHCVSSDSRSKYSPWKNPGSRFSPTAVLGVVLLSYASKSIWRDPGLRRAF